MKLPLRTQALTGLLITAGVFCIGLINPQSVSAITGSDFNASKIIDDAVFYNSDAMNSSDIQDFLNAKVPTCDTNGTLASTRWYAGGNRYYTRAEWGSLNGNPAPYTCLRNYTESTPTKPADSYCTGTYTGGTKTGAQIINDVSKACSISPKTILVLLQKEQSLITDDWPWPIQYRSATGYGCPDTAACDSQYYGFFNQVYNAARQYQRYAKQSNLFNYRSGTTSYIQYNPNSGCGGSNIYIQNSATAGLYNYTPYQPNAAALANLYGSGDGCSAYGNRNFWRLFNDWFGFDPASMIMNGVTMRTIVAPDNSPYRGQNLEYTFILTNNLSVDLPLSAVGIVGRNDNPFTGQSRDFDWYGPVTLHAGETLQFTFNSVVRDTRTIYAWPALNYQGTYVHFNTWGQMLQPHLPRLTATTPLTSSANNPVAGQSVTLSATIRNDEDTPITLEASGIPIRLYGTYTYDRPWATTATLAPGATKNLSSNVTFDKAGPYTAWLSAVVNGQFNTLSNNLSISVPNPSPNFTLSYLELPNTSPALGEDVAVKFKLKNNLGAAITMDAVGVVGRFDSPFTGPNKDLGWAGSITFAAGEEKSFTTFTTNISQLNNYYVWPALYFNGGWYHYNNWGFMLQPRVPNITLSSPLTVSAPLFGNTATVSATIKNNETKPIKYSAAGIAARYYGTYNYDATWQGSGTLAAAGQSGDNVSLSGTIFFDKRGPYTLWTSLNINGRYLVVGNQQSLNL